MESSDSSILEVIAVNIKAIRKDKGLTQEQLAHKASIDRSYMGYIENAKHGISVVMLERIALALEVDVYQLLKDHTDKL